MMMAVESVLNHTFCRKQLHAGNKKSIKAVGVKQNNEDAQKQKQ